MKIRLLCNLSVGDEHGMTEGRVLDAIGTRRENARDVPCWLVMGDAGVEVSVYPREAELVKPEEASDE